MRDTKLYESLLGLEKPWSVARVELDVELGRVDVWVEHPRGLKWPCPECGERLACRDHARERKWRHLDSCQFQTYLHARIPRVDCPVHGVRQTEVPWALARSRFTALMEAWIINVLLQCATVQGACRLLGLSWDEVWGVLQRAVLRGKERKQVLIVPRYGVDEKSFRKGQSYMTVVCDVDRGTVEHVGDARTTESLETFWDSLTTEQREGIETIAMDMWQGYVTATVNKIPGARTKIVFDHFHIMRYVVDAVDKVRRQEHKALLKRGDETLKGTRQMWLYSRENLPGSYLPTLQEVQQLNLEVSQAWALKESLRKMWDYLSVHWARNFFNDWYAQVMASKLKPIQEVAKLLKRNLDNILTYCEHRVTNSMAEGINSKIMAIKRRVGGFRNAEHFKTAIYFYCGGLDLDPH